MANGYLATVNGYLATANGYLVTANRHFGTAYTKTNGYLATANGNFARANGYLATANGYLAITNEYSVTADGHFASSKWLLSNSQRLMTFTLGLVCGPEMTCDEGWIMSAGAPVCYLPVNVSMNWEFASLTCERFCSEEVISKILGLSRNVKDVNETVWNGREVVSDEDGIWDINQPDTNRNKLTCVAAKQNHLGRWSYEDCLTKLPFVCKKKSKLKGEQKYCDDLWLNCDEMWLNCDDFWLNCDDLWLHCDDLWLHCDDLCDLWLNCDDLWLNCDDLWLNCDYFWLNCDDFWLNCDDLWLHCDDLLFLNVAHCPNGDVIPPRLICDDENDCGDNSDELGNVAICTLVVKGTVLEENADFVEIISASTTLPNRLTGRILHDSVIYSARNHMLKIILNSDDSQSGVFVAHWQAEDIVQNWELTTPAVGSEIISFYSLPYKQYEWIITAKDQNVVTLQFHILNVDKVSGSYWILFDGNQPVLPRNTGDIYISRSKSVKIVLVSYSVSNQLSITYSQGCKILLSFQQYTSISSPGFQEENNFGYPNGVYCEWDIYSLYNYSASIKFTDFNLKQDSDYLTIINSTTNFHPNRGFSGDGAITNTTVFRSTVTYCGVPPAIDYGYIVSSTGVIYDETVTYRCNEGFTIDKPIIYCQANGQWEVKPKCTVNGTIYVTQQLTCGADGTFRDPTGEKSELLCIDMDECKLGSNTCKTNQRCVNNLGSYTCSCRHGYKPDADPNKDCININECEVNNGGCSQNCTDEIPGYFCTCQMGYELYMHDGFNNISLAKGEDGKREGDVYYINHTCVRKQCPQPVSPENSFVLSQKQLFYYGDTVEYKCNHGYKMSFSNSIRTCVGSCQTQFQESDRNINRVLPGSGVTINYGEESIIECSYGTKLINRTQYCGYTGSDTYVIDCGPPVVIPGSSFTFPVKTSFGEAFIFKCLDGFVEEGVSTLGSSIVKCEQNGRWGMGNLTCNGETCLDPGTPGGAKQVVTSYEEGKLLYFQCDRNGYMPVPPEPFLCHVDGGSIKWNSTELPICKVFSNCPSNILYVDYMERINYNIPTATDNSGVIKKISVSPAYMKPNTVINNDTEITYYAEDYAGNIAMCLIQVKIKRRQVPTLQCASGPIAVEIWDIFFKNFIPQETLVNFVTPNFSLAISQIEPFTSLNEPPKEIRITAMDPYGTAMSCSILAFPLGSVEMKNSINFMHCHRTCTSGRNNTLTCTVTCNTGYIFNDGKQTQKYQCEKANNSQSYQPIIWTPRSSPNDCLLANLIYIK
ncbi:LOW QUALITY PROTEIN: hypothetical protein KUTeg_011802 [Tegillarca granosa]|uniref:Uncharacterized protein n=1 Tax=Tegillarca granosa TaxID=220873 RepID=A0ABQ9EXQ0_TEGGR|nr:LOW QUALITY PROTEIN: hypothetical protein KUTeg_011802 [Tegillarca granosa]